MASTLPDSEGCVRLVDGETLTGWKGDGAYWSVDGEHGYIVGKNESAVPSSTYLFTAASYHEFRLLFEVRQVISPAHSTMHSVVAALGEQIEDKGNNTYRFKEPLIMFCHDWGIWYAHGRNRVVPDGQKGAIKRGNDGTEESNQIEILVKGDRIRFVANGTRAFDFTDKPGVLQRSPIGLQLHANAKPQEFHFRGLWLSAAPGDALVTASP